MVSEKESVGKEDRAGEGYDTGMANMDYAEGSEAIMDTVGKFEELGGIDKLIAEASKKSNELAQGKNLLKMMRKDGVIVNTEELEDKKNKYEAAIQRLENSGENLKMEERSYLINKYGDSAYYDAIDLRYENMVTKHIYRYNLYFNSILNDINLLLNIFQQLGKNNEITKSALKAVEQENKRLKKEINTMYASIQTNNRNAFYIDNEIGKMNIFNGMALFLYYLIFVVYIIKLLKNNNVKTKITYVIALILAILPIIILPFILFIGKNIVKYIKNISTSGPENAFLNIHEYKPPLNVGEYELQENTKKAPDKQSSALSFLWI